MESVEDYDGTIRRQTNTVVKSNAMHATIMMCFLSLIFHFCYRFLKRNTQTNLWEDVGDEVAREKASQVLRDAVAALSESTSRPGSVTNQINTEGSFGRSSHAGRLLALPSLDASDASQTQSLPGLQSASSDSFLVASPVASSRYKRARYHQPSEQTHLFQQWASHPPTSPLRRHSENAPAYFQPRRDERASIGGGGGERPRIVRRSTSGHSQMSGNTGDTHPHTHLSEFDLFDGELLESDTEGKQESHLDDNDAF